MLPSDIRALAASIPRRVRRPVEITTITILDHRGNKVSPRKVARWWKLPKGDEDKDEALRYSHSFTSIANINVSTCRAYMKKVYRTDSG